MSTLNVNKIADASGGVLAPISSVMRNRLINGAMVISQRSGTSAVTIDGGATYGVDRWKGEDGTDGAFTIQQTTTAPAGFNNSTKITITTADTSLGATQYSYFGQIIEGYNFSDLGWGTANAKTVTLSFWVQSSVTGTYTASFINESQNRSYPATFTISVANTWEYKTITVAGDTTGTWVGATNGSALKLYICMGTGSTYTGTGNAWAGSLFFNATGSVNLIGTNGATFYITGVQLEVGTQATSFEYRQYTTELQLCQRYFVSYGGGTAYESVAIGYNSSTTNAIGKTFLPVEMRTAPTVFASTTLGVYDGASVVVVTSVSVDQPSSKVFNANYVTASGLTSFRPIGIIGNNSTAARLQLSAEL
jgi:hypothetical protein